MIVDVIKYFNKMYEGVINTNVFFQIKIINDENIKINANDEDSYKAIVNLMFGKDYSYHSYEHKQDQSYGQKMPHSCVVKIIVYDPVGWRIIEASPKLEYKTKQPLYMFILSFIKEDKIFDITDIMSMTVETVPLKKNNLISQWKN